MPRRVLNALALLGLALSASCNSPTDNQTQSGGVLWYDRGLLVVTAPRTDGARTYVESFLRTATAIDNANGNAIWSASTATGDTATNQTDITLGEGGCTPTGSVVLCNDDGLVALRASDGAFLWRTSRAVNSCPTSCRLLVTRDSTAFWLTSTDSLMSARTTTGARRWAVGGYLSLPIISVDSALVAVGYLDYTAFPIVATIEAFNDATGAVLWKTKLGSAARIGGTALWQGVVLASASDGNVYALDRTTGSVAWTVAATDTSSRAIASFFPCVAGPLDQPLLVIKNTLFVETITGSMIMIDLPSHGVLHRTTPGLGSHNGYPLVADTGAVYVAHQGGLAAYSTADAHLTRAISLFDDQVCGVAPLSDRLILTGITGIYAISR